MTITDYHFRPRRAPEETHFQAARRIVGEIEEDQNAVLSADLVRQKIMEKFKSEGDIELLKMKISLLDANTKVRIRVPVRSVNCEHFQCFDLHSFLETNLRKKSGDKTAWCCPVATCEFKAGREQIRIDGYFNEILKKVGPLPLEVELLADGSWHEVEQEDVKEVPYGENGDIVLLEPRKKAQVEITKETAASHSGTGATKSDDFAQISWTDLGQLLGIRKGDCPLEAIRSLKQRLELSEGERGTGATKSDDFAQISWTDLGDLLGVKKGDCPLEAIRALKQRLELSEGERETASHSGTGTTKSDDFAAKTPRTKALIAQLQLGSPVIALSPMVSPLDPESTSSSSSASRNNHDG